MIKNLMSLDTVRELLKLPPNSDDDIGRWFALNGEYGKYGVCTLNELNEYASCNTINHNDRYGEIVNAYLERISKMYLTEEKLINLLKRFNELPDILTLDELKQYFSIFPADYVIRILLIEALNCFDVGGGYIRVLKAEVFELLLWLCSIIDKSVISKGICNAIAEIDTDFNIDLKLEIENY